jgi:hypothetical protein
VAEAIDNSLGRLPMQLNFQGVEERHIATLSRKKFICGHDSHMNQCKASKHAGLLHGCNRSLRFSTFFFTELLKRGRN